VGEHLRHLRQAQLRVGGEACLQAEERGDDQKPATIPLERDMPRSVAERASRGAAIVRPVACIFMTCHP
jgi:hypothetical protein